MLQKTRDQQIGFLVKLKVPDAELFAPEIVDPNNDPIPPFSGNHYGDVVCQKAEEYRNELMDLSDADLDQLYRDKVTDDQESRRFYSQIDATADFEHWSKCTYWTVDEAVALTLGKAPEVVTWEKVKKEYRFSPFVRQYSRIRNLAIRAVQWRQIYAQTMPGVYLAWAKQSGVEVPEALVDAVEARGIQIANWKDHYETLNKQFEELEEIYGKALRERTDLIKKAERLSVEKKQKENEVNSLVKERDDWLSEKESISIVREELEALQHKQYEDDPLLASGYWSELKGKILKAVEEYPEWRRKLQRSKLSKESDLTPWVKKEVNVNDREASIVKKVLSDIYSELQ